MKLRGACLLLVGIVSLAGDVGAETDSDRLLLQRALEKRAALVPLAGAQANLAEEGEGLEEPPGIVAAAEPDDELAILQSLCEASPYQLPARYLYQGAEILAIGRSVAPEPGEVASATASGVLTFAVTPEAAQRIASVDSSTLYLTLVPETIEPYPIPQLDVFEVLPGEEEGRLTPLNTVDSFDPNKVSEGAQ